ncbi:MAG: hypothetical protein ACOYO1_02450 [Bacteroidales bacterium]
MSNETEEKPGMIYVEESQLRALIEENKRLKDADQSARSHLNKILLAYNELEKDGIVKIMEQMINGDSGVMTMIGPIGRIIPKVKKYGDNENITNVFNLEFFETAKKAAL